MLKMRLSIGCVGGRNDRTVCSVACQSVRHVYRSVIALISKGSSTSQLPLLHIYVESHWQTSARSAQLIIVLRSWELGHLCGRKGGSRRGMHMNDGFLTSRTTESINAISLKCKAYTASLSYPFTCSRHRFNPRIKRQRNQYRALRLLPSVADVKATFHNKYSPPCPSRQTASNIGPATSSRRASRAPCSAPP